MRYFQLFERAGNRQAPWGTALVFFIFTAATPAQQALPQTGGVAVGADVTSTNIEALMNLDVTTASRFADKLSDAPSIMSVVTSDELRRFGGMTLGEILQRVAGLTGTSQYLTDRSMVAARGDQTKTAGGYILNGELRYDLRKLLHLSDRNGLAIVVHANNLTDFRVWLPSWGFTSVDTIPVEQGRVVYAGLRFSAGKN